MEVSLVPSTLPTSRNLIGCPDFQVARVPFSPPSLLPWVARPIPQAVVTVSNHSSERAKGKPPSTSLYGPLPCRRVSEVTITIKNQGEEAYKPKEYGKSIVITRRFTKEGGSSWKIKSKDGKVISTKKDELAAICDHMNIQVDNPMNVLTQGGLMYLLVNIMMLRTIFAHQMLLGQDDVNSGRHLLIRICTGNF